MDLNSVYLIGDLKLENISKCDQVSGLIFYSSINNVVALINKKKKN